MSKPKTPLLAVDIIIRRFEDGKFLFIKRKNDPFKDLPALPGGFVDIGETVKAAARRELLEETGVPVEVDDLYFVGEYSEPDRDPRGHVVSMVYFADVDKPKARAGDDAAAVLWMHPSEAYEQLLAFDHNAIIKDAIDYGFAAQTN